MTSIINRKPTGRLISLHSEIKYLYKRFGLEWFELKGLKYDANAEYNPLMFFPLAKQHPVIGLYDPYLENPLDKTRFHLTQSVQYDTQKSKGASETLNALEALNWVVRQGNLSRLSEEGIKIASIEYMSEDFFELSRKSVLGYGVFIGFLFKCFNNSDTRNIVNKTKVILGYPNTNERINVDGINVPLSTGSEQDTIVRTRSTLFAWAITTGFALPVNHPVPSSRSTWHIETLDEIASKQANWGEIKMFLPDDLFTKKTIVTKPLSYDCMTKTTRALRERGQQAIRRATMEQEVKVKNRRFALVYLLALAAKNNISIDFRKMIEELSKHPDLFVVDKGDFFRVMNIELEIAVVAGIPYSRKGDILEPLTQVDIDSLIDETPSGLVSILNLVYNNLQ